MADSNITPVAAPVRPASSTEAAVMGGDVVKGVPYARDVVKGGAYGRDSFDVAYNDLGTGRLITSGVCEISKPQINDSTGEVKVFGGKVKRWFTVIPDLRPSCVDYQTGKDIVIPGAVEVYLTPEDEQRYAVMLASGYTSGIPLKARNTKVAAYDIPSDQMVKAVLEAKGMKLADLPHVLLIEKPDNSLNYADARNRNQAARQLEAGRGHYLTDTQQTMAGKGLFNQITSAFKNMMAS